jgi:hypothetical protein
MRLLPLALVLSFALPALAADRGKAEKALKDALAAESAEGIQTACDDLIECGGKESINVILGLAPRVEGSMYWQLANAASGFKDAPALDELGKFIVAHQSDSKSSLSRDLLFGLQNNHSDHVVAPLGYVLEKGSFDLKLLAVDQLALNRSIETIDALVAGYKHEDKGDEELKKRIENALHLLTGESFGSATDWETWWKGQRPSGVPAPKAKAGEGGGATGGTMEKPRDNEWHGTIEKLGKERIVVLEGCYDETQSILEANKIPHTVAKKADFDADPSKYLKDAFALLINCDDCYEGKPPGAPGSGGKRMSDKTLQAIKQWVEGEGGYLFTEDWGLIDVTSVLWPDKVETLGGAVPPMLDEATVKLVPVKGSTTHPLMRGVWQKPRKAAPDKKEDEGKTKERVESPAEPLKHTWKVDNLSAAIKIVDPQNVIPLLESEELAKAKNGTAAVAVTFRVGTWNPGPKKQATGPGASPRTAEFSSYARGGRVLHTISHFGHQSSEDDGQALQNLLINFMLEAAKHHSPH